MLWSKTFIPTLKEDPQEAEAISHKLMLRAGLIRRLTAGTYTYLPLGYKILRKAENIIREEINKTGAAEILMPALQPPELWKKTGRYDDIGRVMMKCIDRHGKEVVLGPTHEEIVTNLVSGEVRSYKDLPLILYQIQTKFRDEVRPRFGIVRSCEFIMKDAYSFDVDAEAMEMTYKSMYDAYCRIFERCGLDYVAVEADPGLMGGTVSHEFMIPAEIGEDKIVICAACKYAASTEVAAVKQKDNPKLADEKPEKIKEVATPKMKSVQEISAFLKISPAKILKTLIYIADNVPVVIIVRGDHEVNETKIKNYLRAKDFQLADESDIRKVTGAPMGFSGPVGLHARIIADNSVRAIVNAVSGANEKDKHLCNVNLDRDFKVNDWVDARVVIEGDSCPKCGNGLEFKYAIELGHTFKLGTKYSGVLNASILDKTGNELSMVMGCYGIGVNRILAALIENSHDKDGIIWPRALSPYEVVVIPVKSENQELYSEAEKIYNALKTEGVDVIFDDRQKSPGIKFKDADLIGFPLQVIIGSKSLEQGKIEIKNRTTGEKMLVDKNGIIQSIKMLLSK